MTHEPHVTASELVSLCASRGLTVATGESVTAGGVAAAIAAIPGASTVLRGGVVAYHVDLKKSMLQVSDEDLAHGIVSREVARAMARGAAASCGATLGVGTTGVAGPTSHDGSAVGTVAVAVSWEGREEAVLRHFDGSRADIIDQAVVEALQMLLAAVAVQAEGSS